MKGYELQYRKICSLHLVSQVWWEGVPSRGRLIGYQVFYTTTAIEDLDTWQSTSVGVTESADLINLEKHSQYTVIVCARTKTGLGRVSQKEIVKLKPEEVRSKALSVLSYLVSLILTFEDSFGTRPKDSVTIVVTII